MMQNSDFLMEALTWSTSVKQGMVVDLSPLRVNLEIDGVPSAAPIESSLLQSSETPLVLNVGDPVLLWQSGDHQCVILGRIGPGRLISGTEAGFRGNAEAPEAPGELVIEARTSLTLRVGDGSITIREDGRILIKGRELVSHAKGMNRIRGGAVAIN